MRRSTMFQSKISKTKKRLSDERWTYAVPVVCFFGLFAVLGFCLRAATIQGVYGVIPAEMPVVAASVDDPGFHNYREQPRQGLGKTTPAVVLTTEAFFFGDLASFTTNFSDVHDKYVLRHVDGEPQLFRLIEQMEAWLQQEAAKTGLPQNDVLVLVPTGDIPMPIVIQVMAGLRKSHHFQRIVLGSGLF